jgi:hypothetical protein
VGELGGGSEGSGFASPAQSLVTEAHDALDQAARTSAGTSDRRDSDPSQSNVAYSVLTARASQSPRGALPRSGWYRSLGGLTPIVRRRVRRQDPRSRMLALPHALHSADVNSEPDTWPKNAVAEQSDGARGGVRPKR